MSITNNNFVSFDKLHYINVVINKQTAYFKIHYYNEDNMKTFLELFKDVVSFLHKNNIINIRQEISNNEVEESVDITDNETTEDIQEEKKEGFFKRIINLIKGLFSRSPPEEQE